MAKRRVKESSDEDGDDSVVQIDGDAWMADEESARVPVLDMECSLKTGSDG